MIKKGDVIFRVKNTGRKDKFGKYNLSVLEIDEVDVR